MILFNRRYHFPAYRVVTANSKTLTGAPGEMPVNDSKGVIHGGYHRR